MPDRPDLSAVPGLGKRDLVAEVVWAQDAHARADMARAVVASAMPPEAVLAALSEDERARLEARARAAVPPGVSEATAAALLPGIMAGLAEEG